MKPCCLCVCMSPLNFLMQRDMMPKSQNSEARRDGCCKAMAQ
jgi:hypothetical protein